MQAVPRLLSDRLSLASYELAFDGAGTAVLAWGTQRRRGHVRAAPTRGAPGGRRDARPSGDAAERAGRRSPRRHRDPKGEGYVRTTGEHDRRPIVLDL